MSWNASVPAGNNYQLEWGSTADAAINGTGTAYVLRNIKVLGAGTTATLDLPAKTCFIVVEGHYSDGTFTGPSNLVTVP